MAEITAKQLSEILDLTVARVGQLAKEGVVTRFPSGKYPPGAITQYVRWLRNSKNRYENDGEKLDREFLIAKTELTKSQNIKLKRQLALDAGNLIRAEYLDAALLTFLKHFESQTDWIRSNRTGDHELLKAHMAAVEGARRECHSKGTIEGSNVDAD
jgi:hypothetical protein